MPFVRFGIVPGLIESDEQRNTLAGSILLLWSGDGGRLVCRNELGLRLGKQAELEKDTTELHACDGRLRGLVALAARQARHRIPAERLGLFPAGLRFKQAGQA